MISRHQAKYEKMEQNFRHFCTGNHFGVERLTVMLLNLSIIHDRLQSEHHLISAPEQEYSCKLQGVRLLTSSSQAPDQSHVYVIMLDSELDSLGIISSSQGLSLIIIGTFDERLLRLNNHQAIVMSSSEDPQLICNAVMEIFEYYDNWYSRITEALITAQPLQVILDIGAEVLANPFAFLDTSMGLICKAGELPDDITGTIWEVLLGHGYTPTDLLPARMRPIVDRKTLSGQPFLVKVPQKWRDQHWMICGIFVKGDPVGTLGAAEVFSPFTSGQLALVSVLKQALETALATTTFTDGPDEFMHFVSRLLLGFAVDARISEYQLARKAWHKDDSYRMYCMAGRTEGFEQEWLSKYVIQLQTLEPNWYVFVHEQQIIAIEHLNEGLTTSLLQAYDVALRDFLLAQDLQAGVSLVYSDFDTICTARGQAQMALSLASSDPIRGFGEYFLDCFTASLSSQYKLECFVQPQILQLWQSQKDQARENIRSLACYLTYGRNLSATAKALHVHRNTLDYRLARISKALRISLDELSETELFFFLMSCKLVMEL